MSSGASRSDRPSPPWLTALLSDTSPAPRLYAWTVANLPPASADAGGRDSNTDGTAGPAQQDFSAASDLDTSAPIPADDDAPPAPPPSTAARRPHIYLLGAGNIGRLLASSLVRNDRVGVSSTSPPQPPPRVTLVVHRRALLEQWAAVPGVEMERRGRRERTVAGLDVEWWTEERPRAGPVREVASSREEDEVVVGGEGTAGQEAAAAGPSDAMHPPGGGTIQHLVVATKAGAALGQVDRVRRYLGPASTVAFAMNGISRLWPPHGADYVAARWPGWGRREKNRSLAGRQEEEDGSLQAGGGEAGQVSASGPPAAFLAVVTTNGVRGTGRPFSSVHASEADLAVGPVLLTGAATAQSSSSSSSYLTEQLATAPHLGGRVVARPELFVLQLEKLVVNASINPVTAVVRCRNSALFPLPRAEFEERLSRSEPAAAVMDLLIREASDVLQALVRHESTREILHGFETGGTSQTQGQGSLEERFSFPALRKLVYNVGYKVWDNDTSMLQDVRAGRPTEIRDFNGWIVETAQYLDENLDVTNNQTMIRLVENSTVLERHQLGKYFPTIRQ